MKAALVATWTQPVPGREKKALQFGAEATAFWTKKAAEGKCTAPEFFFAETGVGMWMVKGDRLELAAAADEDEARLLNMKGDLLLQDYALVLYHTGDSADQFMATYDKALNAIG